MTRIYQVGDDEDINAAVIRVTGAPADWHHDGRLHVKGNYTFTGHVLGDIVTVTIDPEGTATFTVT